MILVNATKERSRLYNLIDETASFYQLIVMTFEISNTVLVSEVCLSKTILENHTLNA